MFEFIVLIFFGCLFFWLWMLVDWIYHEPNGKDKGIWLFLLIMLNIVGAILYLCLRYRENRKKINLAVEPQA